MTTESLAAGDLVRYLPGTHTCGYELATGPDGRVPGVVVGFTSTRVRVKLTMGQWGEKVTVVDAASLERA